MFKMLKPTFLVVPVAWLAVFLLTLLNGVSPFLVGLGITPSKGWVIIVAQAIVTLVFLTPIWRFAWRILPKLNHWFYPDLNGRWDVEVLSNWPRIDQMLKSANGESPAVDVRRVPLDDLLPLTVFKMEAEITQSWLSMDIVLWNPNGDTPIKESQTRVVEPFRGKHGRHGLAYIFEQENNRQEIADDRTFKGAGWLERDRENPNVLCGRMWSDRMWERGMNTAADLRFIRKTQ